MIWNFTNFLSKIFNMGRDAKIWDAFEDHHQSQSGDKQTHERTQFLEKDFSQEVREQALRQLKDVAAKHDIPYSHVNVEIGSPADEIHHMAEKINADLIVVGTHGQSGLRLLLGSTANAVLHGVKTDVLAVKV